jgi:hypothetical protein
MVAETSRGMMAIGQDGILVEIELSHSIADRTILAALDRFPDRVIDQGNIAEP